MSDYFPGHPLPDTTYNITVVAVNEGGRGITNAPICKYICLLSCAVVKYTHTHACSYINCQYFSVIYMHI